METTTKQKFTFFWGGTFSQWCPSIFILDDRKFTHAEQYMMFKKAMLFGDTETAEKIMQAEHPRQQKALGRTVKGFDKTVWEKHCKQFVYDANYAKFTQNPKMLEVLMATGDTELVEASPEDNIWGIGLAEEDPRAQNKETWQGTNWLGEAITAVREKLKSNTNTNESTGDKPTITLSELGYIQSKLSIKIGEIISAERIPKSNGLKLTVNFGHLPQDVKTSFTNLGKSFEPEVFVGKKMPFIMNLEPTVIKGVNSEVMIVVGEHEYLGGIDLDNYRVGSKLI